MAAKAESSVKENESGENRWRNNISVATSA